MASQGAKQLATAWCARNREATLTSLKSGVEMPLNDCEGNPVAEHYALGNRLGVRGTPAIVTSDGQMIPGYDQLQISRVYWVSSKPVTAVTVRKGE